MFSCAKVVHDKKIITYPLSYQIPHQSFALISALESTDPTLDDIYIYIFENLGLVRDLIRKMPCDNLDVLKYISDIVNMFYIIIIFYFNLQALKKWVVKHVEPSAVNGT
jgi:hypothetical protein